MVLKNNKYSPCCMKHQLLLLLTAPLILIHRCPCMLSLLLLEPFPSASPRHWRSTTVLLFICNPFGNLFQCTEIPCWEPNSFHFPMWSQFMIHSKQQSVRTLNAGGDRCLEQTFWSPRRNTKSLLNLQNFSPVTGYVHTHTSTKSKVSTLGVCF